MGLQKTGALAGQGVRRRAVALGVAAVARALPELLPGELEPLPGLRPVFLGLRAVLSDGEVREAMKNVLGEDPRELQRSLVREGLSLLAQGLLYPFGYLRSGHRPLRRRDLRTLVFLHGLGANRAIFYPMQAYLRLLGHDRQFSYNLGHADSVEQHALRLKRELDSNVKGGRIDLIAHSLGGLIARYYVLLLGGARRVDRLITLASPHHGTYSSAYYPTPLVRQLMPGSPLLRQLEELPLPAGLSVTTLAAAQDLIILPPGSALLEGATARMLEDLGHYSILFHPKVFQAVAQALK